MKRWIDLALGILVGVVLSGIAVAVAAPPRGKPVTLLPPPPTPTPAPLVVDVAGAVQRPGVYALPQGSRVRDAIQAAGGFRSDAAAEVVNQAAMVTDGLWIYVPFRHTPTPYAVTPTPAPLGTAVSAAARVNINTASVAQLETLPHIGPALAQRIVDYRTAHGPFRTVDDLVAVKGIGATLLGMLRPYITVGEGALPTPAP